MQKMGTRALLKIHKKRFSMSDVCLIPRSRGIGLH